MLLVRVLFMKFWCLSCIFLCFFSCAPSGTEEFQIQGEVILKKLVAELSEVKNGKDLAVRKKKIKKQLADLTDILMASGRFAEKHPDSFDTRREELEETVFALRCELFRIYALDGGREMMEELQKDSFLKLSLFEKTESKRRY